MSSQIPLSQNVNEVLRVLGAAILGLFSGFFIGYIITNMIIFFILIQMRSPIPELFIPESASIIIGILSGIMFAYIEYNRTEIREGIIKGINTVATILLTGALGFGIGTLLMIIAITKEFLEGPGVLGAPILFVIPGLIIGLISGFFISKINQRTDTIWSPPLTKIFLVVITMAVMFPMLGSPGF